MLSNQRFVEMMIFNATDNFQIDVLGVSHYARWMKIRSKSLNKSNLNVTDGLKLMGANTYA